MKSNTENSGSVHGREVQCRSILLHSCPDPSDRGEAGGHKRQQGFQKSKPTCEVEFYFYLSDVELLEQWFKAVVYGAVAAKA